MLTQDFCCFYNDLEIYDDFRGVVKDDSEGREIAACLGGSKAVLMQNHGPLTVGETVEEVSLWVLRWFSGCSLLTRKIRLFSGLCRLISVAKHR